MYRRQHDEIEELNGPKRRVGEKAQSSTKAYVHNTFLTRNSRRNLIGRVRILCHDARKKSETGWANKITQIEGEGATNRSISR